MDRLSALDESFLRVETPTAHMHVGWSATVGLAAGADRLDVDDLKARMRARLHLVPRFRQVVRSGPGVLGTAAWVDDAAFRLENHLTVEHSERVSEQALGRLADRFFSEPLPRERPLWRLHVVPRLVGGRAAVLGKVHHAMVDGVAAVQLGLLLFDTDPAAPVGEPQPWIAGGSGPLRLAAGAARDSALSQFRAARHTARLGLSPGSGIRVANTVRRAAFSLAEDALRPAPDSYLNPDISARRRLIGTTVSLPRLNAIKERTHTKLNDVVLALVAGALSRLADAHGQQADDLRVMIPASVRGKEHAEAGNAISFLFLDLPVGSKRPRDQTRVIHERTRALKQQDRIAGTDELLQMLGYLPGPIQGPAARLAASPRMYNLTVSNVPGPRFPLYISGAEVRSILPVVPIPDRHAIAIGALSYNQQIHLAAYTDPDALPRAGRLPIMVADALEELDLETRHEARAAA